MQQAFDGAKFVSTAMSPRGAHKAELGFASELGRKLAMAVMII